MSVVLQKWVQVTIDETWHHIQMDFNLQPTVGVPNQQVVASLDPQYMIDFFHFHIVIVCLWTCLHTFP